MTIAVKLDQIVRRRFRHRMIVDGGSDTLRPKLAIVDHPDAIHCNALAAEILVLLKDGMYEGCFTGCRQKGPPD